MAEAWSGGTVSTVPPFLSHTTLTYRQGRSMDMMRAHPGGDGEDAKDSHRGPPYFYVGKFCFFLVFVLSNQTEAGTPCPFKVIWSGYGRRSVFFFSRIVAGETIWSVGASPAAAVLQTVPVQAARITGSFLAARCPPRGRLSGSWQSSIYYPTNIFCFSDTFPERVKRHVVTTTAWSFYGKKVPPFVQTHHHWACHVPQPYVLRAHGRYGHHQRRLHRPQIHGFL